MTETTDIVWRHQICFLDCTRPCSSLFCLALDGDASRKRDKNGASNSTRVKMEMPGTAKNDRRARLSSSSSPEREREREERHSQNGSVSLFLLG